MRTSINGIAGAVVVLTLSLMSACDDQGRADDPDRIVLNPPAEGADHTHAPGESDPAPLGDGTRPTAAGYRLTDVRLPAGTDGPGELSFRILGPDGRPVAELTEQQTKELHLYVVRTDYAVYRHLHPVSDRDGSWTAPVDLDEPGDYRVIADFLPNGTERPLVLGAVATVPGKWRAASLPAGDVGDDGVVRVRVDGTAEVGENGRLHLVVTTVDDEPVTLGTYLGSSAHVSGFRTGGGTVRDGVFVHVHPYGEPEPTDDGTRLTFHTTFTRAGDYRLFVQVRVDGLLHSVPVTATVEP